MNIYIKSVIAGLVLSGAFFLFFGTQTTSTPRYQVHYLLGLKKQGKNSGRNDYALIGEIPSLIKARISDLGYFSMIKITDDNNIDIRIKDVRDTIELMKAVLRNEGQTIRLRPVLTLEQLPTFFDNADRVSEKLKEGRDIYTLLSPAAPRDLQSKTIYPASIGTVSKFDTAELNRILRHPSLISTLPGEMHFCYGIIIDENIRQNIPDDLYLYAINDSRNIPEILNEDVDRAIIDDGYNLLHLRFTHAGSRKWESLTTFCQGSHIVVIISGLVNFTMEIPFPINDGQATLSIGDKASEMAVLADALNAGADPAALVLLHSATDAPPAPWKPNLALILPIIFVAASTLAFGVLKWLKIR